MGDVAAFPRRVVVLAAGQSLQLDGFLKVLTRHPVSGRTILDSMVDAFAGKEVVVVVGYRAIEVMQTHPRLGYVLNPDWALTSNAMSLGLALTDEPTYVVSGDLFLDRALIERLDRAPQDLALTRRNENRIPSAIHCVIDEAGDIEDLYQGPLRSPDHPEAAGIYKVSSREALRAWKRRCIQHANLFAGQLLPHRTAPIRSVDIGQDELFEINTPVDYLNLVARTRGG
jgi:choline kinase